jgi:hypothetical protein
MDSFNGKHASLCHHRWAKPEMDIQEVQDIQTVTKKQIGV